MVCHIDFKVGPKIQSLRMPCGVIGVGFTCSFWFNGPHSLLLPSTDKDLLAHASSGHIDFKLGPKIQILRILLGGGELGYVGFTCSFWRINFVLNGPHSLLLPSHTIKKRVNYSGFNMPYWQGHDGLPEHDQIFYPLTSKVLNCGSHHVMRPQYCSYNSLRNGIQPQLWCVLESCITTATAWLFDRNGSQQAASLHFDKLF